MAATDLEKLQKVLFDVSCRDGKSDSWIYFLAHGLAFGYYEQTAVVAEVVLFKMQHALACKPSSAVAFGKDEIAMTAGETFKALSKLDIAPEDAVSAITTNAVLMARYLVDQGYGAVDDLWTAFKVGVDNQYLALSHEIIVLDSDGKQSYRAQLDVAARPQAKGTLVLKF